MATGDKLVTLDGLKAAYDKLHMEAHMGQFVSLTWDTGSTYYRNWDASAGKALPAPVSASSGNFKSMIVNCVPGDEFLINGWAGNQAHVWAFVNASGNIISVSPVGVSTASSTENKVVNELLIAPEGAAQLYLNNRYDSWKGAVCYKRIADTGDRIVNNEQNINALMTASTNPVAFDQRVYYQGSSAMNSQSLDRTGYFKANGVDWTANGAGMQWLYLRVVEKDRVSLQNAAAGDVLGYVLICTSHRGSIYFRLGGASNTTASNGIIVKSTAVDITGDVTLIPFVVDTVTAYTGSGTEAYRTMSTWFAVIFDNADNPQTVEVSFYNPSAFPQMMNQVQTGYLAGDEALQEQIDAVSDHETRLSAAEASASASAAALTGLGKLYGGPTYNADIIFWGDSLTQGTGSSNNKSFAGYCADLLGVTRLNCGVGGESANTVACRQGGNLMMIPAGGIGGTYPWSALLDLFGCPLNPRNTLLSTKGAQKAYVNGQEVTLSTHIAQNEEDTSTLTISNYTGAASAVPLPARFIGSTFQGKVHVIFVGTNGASVGSESDTPAAHIAIIDSMLAHIPHNQVVIMGLSRDNEALRGEYDAAMLRHYGARFFPTRKMLVNYGLTLADITATPQDEIDVAEGRVPSSLRSDNVHLNDAGYSVLGTMLANFITTLGYQF